MNLRNSTSEQQAQQASAVDLEDFKNALRELTFNSRPIIEKLTGMARELTRKGLSGQVSRTILDNLVFNNPKIRSCFLFLIDSICKGVGDPYPASFIKHGLVSAYSRVYGEICASGDEGQKRDFLRVLPTWNGVFPPEALKEIETKIGVVGVGGVHGVTSSSHSTVPVPETTRTTTSHSPTTNTNTVKLLSDLQGVFEKPPGPHISGIVGEIFKRLAMEGKLNRRILIDLDAKAKMPDKRIIIDTLKGLIKDHSTGARTVNTGDDSRALSSTNTTSTVPEFKFELPPNFQIDLSLLSSIVELNKINSAGDSSTSINASPSKSSVASVARDRHFIDIPLTSVELLNSRPKLYKVLYDDLPLQCKTCAIRFRDTEKGRARLTDHLDSHFRRNMRLKEKSKRVMARDWFGSEEDWLSNKQESSNATEKTANLFEDSAEISDDSRQVNDDSSVFVEATEDEQGHQIKCEVCQEVISLIWSDENDQWIFPNCIRNENDQIVHLNCSSSLVEGGKRLSKRVKK